MEKRTIERYRKRSRLFHWVHAASFLILVFTGTYMFIPVAGYAGGYSIGIIHRAAAVIFIGIPILNSLSEPNKAWGFIKETFNWGKDDLKWFIAAPNYYFGGPEEKMPPQGRLNSGQKMWQLVIIGTGVVFLSTGAILWFFRWSIPINVYEWVLFVHGIAFITVLAMFLVHFYLAVFHPRYRESLPSMLDGKVSPSYAKKHYGKWYDKIINNHRNM